IEHVAERKRCDRRKLASWVLIEDPPQGLDRASPLIVPARDVVQSQELLGSGPRKRHVESAVAIERLPRCAIFPEVPQALPLGRTRARRRSRSRGRQRERRSRLL